MSNTSLVCGCQSLSCCLFLQQVNKKKSIIYIPCSRWILSPAFSHCFSFSPYPSPPPPYLTPSLFLPPPPPPPSCKQVKTKGPFFVLKWDSTGCLTVRFAPFAADRKCFVVVYLGAVCLFTQLRNSFLSAVHNYHATIEAAKRVSALSLTGCQKLRPLHCYFLR